MITHINLYESDELDKVRLINFGKENDYDLKLKYHLLDLISSFQDEEKKYIPKELNNFTRQIPGEIINSWINNKDLLYILYDGSKEIGFCSVILNHPKFPKTVAHISYLYVTPENRGTGLGSYLLDYAMKKTKELYPNKKHLTLNCFSRNSGALNLYKKYGFTEFTKTLIR